MERSNPTPSPIERNTIVACCTSITGSGSLAIIRVSGPDAFVVADRVVEPLKGVRVIEQASHTVQYAALVTVDRQRLDYGMVTIFRAPASFTGEHTVEITCHHNPLIINALVEQLIFAGARLATRGEFTRQAVQNNKLDLIQAEAINELIAAHTMHAVQQSLAQMRGTFSEALQHINTTLVTLIAWCEASFEFTEEVEADFQGTITTQLETLLCHLRTIRGSTQSQRVHRSGIRIALVGSVNAGKSSLFNALLGNDRAIVTPIAGTTRDTIEARSSIGDIGVVLIDTAGLRTTPDPIEAEGVRRSRSAAHEADCILLVIDQSRIPTHEELETYAELLAAYEQRIYMVITKLDLPAAWDPSCVSISVPQIQISVQHPEQINLLTQQLHPLLKQLLAAHAAPFLVNDRQRDLLLTLEQQLLQIQEQLQAPYVPYELVSINLQIASTTLGDMLGKSVSEAALNKVFQEFCIGK